MEAFWQQYHNVIIMGIILSLFIYKGRIMGFFFGFSSISAKKASSWLGDEGVVVLDVRTEGEFNSGHIKGAKNVPVHMVPQMRDVLKEEFKGKRVLVICHTGSRSATACVSLAKSGLEIYNVTGGMVAWNLMGDRSVLVS